MSPTEEIKSRLDIVNIIGEYVKLTPAGANFKARCPFHDERTPSFMVSRSKQIWHCFGCSEGGDIFAFVMKQEGLEFPDALRLLADKAGVRLRVENQAEKTQRQKLIAVLNAAVSFWAKALAESPRAEEARKYLYNKRHLSPETAEFWQLGYAPDSWEALLDHLTKLGFTTEDIIGAGVAARKMEARGRSAYDRFRNRIIFPIANAHGQIIGVTARTLSKDATEAKYVNTPETSLYHKGAVIYGLDKAKTEIKKQNLAVIVEGNMDVISSHQAGVTNVVAASGTALTSEQARLIKRYTDKLAFCFDADPAGESATLRGLLTALEAGFDIFLITLPTLGNGAKYKDPDELILDNADAWREAIKRAKPMIDYYFDKASQENDLSSLAGKQKVTKLLLPLLAVLPDRVAQTHYLQKLSNLVEVKEQYLREALPKTSPPATAATPTTPSPPAKEKNKADGLSLLSDRLLAAMIFIPEETAYIIEAITPEMLSPDRAALYREMVVFYTGYTAKHPDKIINWREGDFTTFAHEFGVLSLLADKEFTNLEPPNIKQDIIFTVTRLKQAHLRQTLRNLEHEIRVLEKSQDNHDEKLQSLWQEFKILSAELTKLNS